MKNYAYILLGILLLIFVVYVVIDSNNISIIDTILPEKIAVFKNVHMSGIFSSGKLGRSGRMKHGQAGTGTQQHLRTFLTRA